MKKVVAAIAALMLMSGVAVAGDGVYLKGLGKYAMMTNPEVNGVEVDTSDSWGYGFAVGFGMNNFRVEGEWARQSNDIDRLGRGAANTGKLISGSVEATTYMVNGYYDYDIADAYGIYGTGGVGYGHTELRLEGDKGTGDTFVWKIGAGMYYNVTEQLSLDLGYEYLDLGNIADGAIKADDVASNNIVFAVRYSF